MASSCQIAGLILGLTKAKFCPSNSQQTWCPVVSLHILKSFCGKALVVSLHNSSDHRKTQSNNCVIHSKYSILCVFINWLTSIDVKFMFPSSFACSSANLRCKEVFSRYNLDSNSSRQPSSCILVVLVI